MELRPNNAQGQSHGVLMALVEDLLQPILSTTATQSLLLVAPALVDLRQHPMLQAKDHQQIQPVQLVRVSRALARLARDAEAVHVMAVAATAVLAVADRTALLAQAVAAAAVRVPPVLRVSGASSNPSNTR